jgi:hypothetical protein
MINLRSFKDVKIPGAPHFTYGEFVTSDNKELEDALYDDLPCSPQEFLDKIGRRACYLSIVRKYLNRWCEFVKDDEIGIYVESSYRNFPLNKYVGGEEGSFHLTADADDINLGGHNQFLKHAFSFIKNTLGGYSELFLYESEPDCYDQIHIGYWKHGFEPTAGIIQRGAK